MFYKDSLPRLIYSADVLIVLKVLRELIFLPGFIKSGDNPNNIRYADENIFMVNTKKKTVGTPRQSGKRIARRKDYLQSENYIYACHQEEKN